MEPLTKLEKTPLVFVPGIMGSRLFKKGTGEPIWPTMGWWDKGRFKPTSLRAVASTPDKETSQNEPLFPMVYSELLRHLENMGYVLGLNFWVFPYDWTQSNRISGRKLAQFIQDILSIHPQWHKVDVVSHSMGGLVTRAAANLHSAPVRRAVYIASPHFGSPKAFFILHPKMKFSVFGGFFKNIIGDLAWRWYLHRLVDTENISLERQIKRLASQLDSVFELLPDRFYFEGNHLVVVKDASKVDCPICGLESTYYSGLCRFPSSQLQDRVREAMAFKEELGMALPGHENLLIYSDSEETVDQMVCPARIQWPFGRYKDGGQKGDSIVPVNSATLYNPVAARKVPGTHYGIPNSLETSLLIEEFLDKA